MSVWLYVFIYLSCNYYNLDDCIGDSVNKIFQVDKCYQFDTASESFEVNGHIYLINLFPSTAMCDKPPIITNIYLLDRCYSYNNRSFECHLKGF